MSDINVPVLIGGGGGAGLTASMLLSSYGIDSLLVSRYPGTSHLPKAHVLQQKTMEVYREWGVISKWAVPEVRFVDLLEKTSVGKLDKKVLRQKYG